MHELADDILLSLPWFDLFYYNQLDNHIQVNCLALVLLLDIYFPFSDNFQLVRYQKKSCTPLRSNRFKVNIFLVFHSICHRLRRISSFYTKAKLFSGILVQAKEKITSLTQENENLTKEVTELKSRQAALKTMPVAASASLTSTYEAQLSAVKAEKDQLIEELNAEKDRLQQQVEHLQNVSFIFLFFC